MLKAVIQAGGQGTRLRPYTMILPKPLMPLGGVPVIEVMLKWLRRNGTEQAYITTGYLGHLIKALCGDGSQWNMNIDYSIEPEPLGTVGALTLLKQQLTETFYVMNGDLLTDLDLHAFRDFHRQHGGMLSVATTLKTVKVDLGVLELSGDTVSAFSEKPVLEYTVSMGVYCMEPDVLELIPSGIPYGFDDLMHQMLDKNLPVHVYKHNGLWMDIGRPEDFQKAQESCENYEQRMLGV